MHGSSLRGVDSRSPSRCGSVITDGYSQNEGRRCTAARHPRTVVITSSILPREWGHGDALDVVLFPRPTLR